MSKIDASTDEDTKISPLINKVDKEQLALNSLDGFLLILSGDGEITFVSANIAEHLGLSQVSQFMQLPKFLDLYAVRFGFKISFRRRKKSSCSTVI